MSKRAVRWVIVSGTMLVLIALGLTALVVVANRRGMSAPTPVPTFAPPAIALTPPSSLQDLVARYPQLADILSDQELDSAYKDFLIAYQQDGIEGATELARQRGLLTQHNEVRATLVLDTTESDELATQLEATGVIVEGVYENRVDIAVPLLLIERTASADDPGALFSQLTALQHVVRVKLPSKTRTDPRRSLLSVTGQGVQAIGADVWQDAGFVGKGVKIGVLDCGFRGYKDLLGVELPDAVQARTFIHGLDDANDSDDAHGTAVAEIIYDVAPGAELYLADYGCSGVAQGQAVEWLLEQKVKIISHSAGSSVAPMDGTGWQAELVHTVTDQGVLWINSAGNAADVHYRGRFGDQDRDGFHEFAENQETMSFQSADPFVEIALCWDDWGKADQDYDLVLLDHEGNELAWARDTQSGSPGDEPAEVIEYHGLEVGQTYHLAIYAARATHVVTFDLSLNGKVLIEFPAPEYSLRSPADAPEALAVGAVFWKNDRITSYSSRGPTADGRLKPDISAPTQVDSATYGSFGGTSAAAPHVSGAAALVWDAFPDFARRDVWNYLTLNVQDLGSEGADNAYGAGRLQLPEPPVAEPPTSRATTQPVHTPGPTDTPTAMLAATQTAAPALPTSTPHATQTPVATQTPLPTPVSGLPSELLTAAAWAAGGGGGLLLLAGFAAAIVGAARRRAQAPRLPQGPPPSVPSAPSSLPPLMTACPHCGRSVRARATFCATCGKSVVPLPPAPGIGTGAVRCRQCGQELRSGARFCARCGTQQ